MGKGIRGKRGISESLRWTRSATIAHDVGLRHSRPPRKPDTCFAWSCFERPELSSFNIRWQLSMSDIYDSIINEGDKRGRCGTPTWRLKSQRILIRASFNPGISSPFLIRRISRMGSISAPTFSKSPRMKAVESVIRKALPSDFSTYQDEFRNTSTNPPTNHYPFGPSRNQSPA